MDKVDKILQDFINSEFGVYEGLGDKTEVRQSLYKLLVDEIPKEKDDYGSSIYNLARTECLAVIKRVLIGGE